MPVSTSVLRGPRTPYVDGERVDDLVAGAARRHPAATALVQAGELVTYAELLRRAESRAITLREAGAGPGVIVAVRADRDVDTVCTLLAIMLCGAVYACVPADWPPARFEAVTRVTAAAVIVRDGVATPRPADPDDRRRDDRSTADCFCVFLTSGSTGEPKAVPAPHRGVARTALDVARLGPPGTVLQQASLAWDVVALELWVTLARGGTVVLAEPGPLTGASLRRATAAGVDTLALPTPLLTALLADDPEALTPVRLVYVGGERLDAATVRRARRLLPGLRLVNAYGPVENTVNTTLWPADTDPGDDVPIGTPVTNTDVLVVDEDTVPVPIGNTGEIALLGDGLSPGYVGLPTETAARFVTVETDRGPERAYLTGDLGRVGPDGLLYYAGRRDRQVKVRGLRIECEEVERLVAATPGVVAACVVAAPHDAPVKTRLAAFYRADGDVAEDDVRQRLVAALPPGFVPDELRRVDTFPRTAYGKVDHRVLAELVTAGSASADTASGGSDYDGSDDSDETDDALLTAVLRAARTLLGHGVAPDADLFDQGATSLTAMRLSTRLARDTGREIGVGEILRHRTSRAVAAGLAAARPADTGAVSLPARSDPAATVRPTTLPWVFGNFYAAVRSGSRLDEAVVPMLYELTGTVDGDFPARLRTAVDTLVRRHEALRTRLRTDGGQADVVVLPAAEVASLLDLLPTEADVASAVRTCQEWALAPFDLADGGPIRAALAPTADPTRAVLAVSAHHIFFDGWSARVFCDELAALLSGAPSGLADGDVEDLQRPGWSYYDVVARHHRDGREALPRAIWSRRTRMADAPQLTLPHAPDALPWTGPVAEVELPIDDVLLRRLSAGAARAGATVTAVFLAAWVRVLQGYTGDADPAVAVPVSGRYSDVETAVVGCLADLTPVRLGTAAASSEPDVLLAAAADELHAAMRPPTVPMSTVMPTLRPGLTRHPLLQAYLLQEELPAATLDLGGVTATRLRTPPANAVPELTVELWPFPAVGGLLRYRVDAVPRADAERLATDLIDTAAAIATGGRDLTS